MEDALDDGNYRAVLIEPREKAREGGAAGVEAAGSMEPRECRNSGDQRGLTDGSRDCGRQGEEDHRLAGEELNKQGMLRGPIGVPERNREVFAGEVAQACVAYSAQAERGPKWKGVALSRLLTR